MNKHTLNIHARVHAGALALACIGALLFTVSCGKSSVREEIKEIDTTGSDALAFTYAQHENLNAPATKATPLTTGFLVDTYKAWGTSDQYPVMSNYRVEYKTSGSDWNGNVVHYWDYACVEGQFLKFWDFSSFPYRFNAVAPCPANASEASVQGNRLTISKPYKMQTSINGMVLPADAEPFTVAQVVRNNDGRDYDVMALNREINMGSTLRNREVALPFHHINSKVRFGIYCTAPWASANHLYIEDLSIRVASAGFVTEAAGYVANGDAAADKSWYIGTGNSGFNGLTTSSSTPTLELLRFSGGRDIEGNDMQQHQGQTSAFWLQCRDGIMQIPQENVSILVSLKLMNADGSTYKEFTDVPIAMADGTLQYDWISGYIHTYYLVIGEVENKLDIKFTATLTPWEDVGASLSTDLEQ